MSLCPRPATPRQTTTMHVREHTQHVGPTRRNLLFYLRTTSQGILFVCACAIHAELQRQCKVCACPKRELNLTNSLPIMMMTCKTRVATLPINTHFAENKHGMSMLCGPKQETKTKNHIPKTCSNTTLLVRVVRSFEDFVCWQYFCAFVSRVNMVRKGWSVMELPSE